MNTEPTILYEDDDVLVINKPEGWMVHEDGKPTDTPIVVDWFLSRLPQAAGVGEPAYAKDGTVLNLSLIHI